VQNLNLDTNKETLKQAFSLHLKKDFTIDCILEGTMCNVKADCQISPAIFLIQNGPFYILGGNPNHPKSKEMLDLIPNGSTILPSPPEWISKLEKQQNITLHKYDRFSLDHNNISVTHLNKIIATNPNQLNIKKIDESLASDIYKSENFQYHFQNFTSETDFLNRGLGYVALFDGLIIGVASSALVCSSGYEINIMVLPEYRGKSLGKLLAANLVKSILINCKVPHWDAANEISLNLAEQLGYDFKDKYQAYRVIRSVNRPYSDKISPNGH
jgi:GNAT superfamily N-acetyltransferase